MTTFGSHESGPSPSLPPPPNPPSSRQAAMEGGNKKSRGCFFYSFFALLFVAIIGLVALIFVALIGVLGATGLSAMGEKQAAYMEETVSKGTHQKVVIIPVQGVITSVDSFQYAATSGALIEQLRQATDDPNVVAIVLDMNTPGGEIVATDEVYHEIQKIREEHGVKVVTCMRSMAASGGYFLAAGTDWIVANRLTFTGSVGVIIGSYNVSELLSKWGIEPMVYKSGSKKDIMSMSREPTPEEAALLQSMIDEAFNEFALVVSKGRNLPLDLVKNPAGPIGDGRVISGLRAKEVGLVDQLGYMEDALAKAKALSSAPGASVVRYKAHPSFADLLRSVKGPDKSIVGEFLPLLQKGQVYYLAPTSL